ncbi:hypothetical protein [Sphaerotilus sp.]|uniref:hypothetical protein n=1 Tax=Sphaerotilus sp. TaxID=2093942 RepID=UPI00286EAD96|nr:hypothetical protein [Sphaerotilus sp.]
MNTSSVEPLHCLKGAAEAEINPVSTMKSPRHLRALGALLNRGLLSREELDRIAGCSNFPGIVFSLRGKGFDLPCERETLVDRDGRTCRPGFYRLSPTDRTKARELLKGSA